MRTVFPPRRLFLCLIIAVASIAACSAGLRNGLLLSEVESPDSSKVADVIRSAGSLGPLDDFNFNVIVRSAKDEYRIEQGSRGTVWLSQSSRPVDLVWLSNSDLAVVIDPGEGHIASMRMRSRPDVSVSTRKNLPDSGGALPVVEVQLANDTKGW